MIMILAPVLGVVGLVCAGLIYLYVARQSEGTELMREIAADIEDGAVTFLKREYSVLAVFIVLVFALVYWGINLPTAISFLGGRALFAWRGFYRDEGGDQGECADGLCRESKWAG